MVTESNTHLNQANRVLHITIKDAGYALATAANTIRMQGVYGEWVVEQQDQMIRVSYQGSGDPAGNMPTWLANRLLLDSTWQTMQNLFMQIQLPQYQ
jgi:hypothetical protein